MTRILIFSGRHDFSDARAFSFLALYKCKASRNQSPSVSNSQRGRSCEQIFDSSTTFLNPLVGTNSLYGKRTVGFFSLAVRLARFARVKLLRHALPISLLILRKKATVLQSKKGAKDVEIFQNGSVHEFCRLKVLITLKQVITSVVEKKNNLQMSKTSMVRLTGRVFGHD